jgi:hypothetical protein
MFSDTVFEKVVAHPARDERGEKKTCIRGGICTFLVCHITEEVL